VSKQEQQLSPPQLYIGIMSGTSADGIDLALVDMSSGTPQLIASDYQPYNEATYKQITSLYQSGEHEIDTAFSLSVVLAQQFSEAVNNFVRKQKLKSSDIVAIGNHGQTIRHRPTISNTITAPFTLQITCNQTLATKTNIRVIGDFRTKDMVLGGQGAPLVPAFHKALFPQAEQDTFVVNIGGIANITFIPENNTQSVIGFDTGPGNALMDEWYKIHQNGRYDENGNWAKSGTINDVLLAQLLSDSYFTTPPPKSTGREYFTLTWLQQNLTSFDTKNELNPEDIQATLIALTAHSIANDINNLSTKSNVYLCGGGTLNGHLFSTLKQLLNNKPLATTDSININSEALEASAFAWFAYAFDKKIPGNIPAVTGATKEAVLGIQTLP
jgi:anhydro-N-acetylmuramic acid kinase